ncbi:hypothetical protein ACFL23_01645 [Patescibacteria group bacterium]
MTKISQKIKQNLPCGEIDDPLPIMGRDKTQGFYFSKFLAKNSIHSLNILILMVLIAEMIMPHKIYAFGGINTNNRELALLADKYTFNGKYLDPEEELINGRYRVVSSRNVATTAYSSTVDQCDADPFIAASGKRVHDGMVAANFLKFNTKIRIPDVFGNKVFIVEDRMNRRFQNRVDIWMNTRQEAMNYGKRNVKIEILEEVQ